MPTAITLNSRLIAMEDVALTDNPNGETFTANVLGLGTTTLSKLAPILLTDLPQATGELDSTITNNVPQGALYFNTTNVLPQARILPWRETPSGGMNGNNTLFTFTHTPVRLLLYKNGALLKDGSDYVAAGAIIQLQGGSGTVNVSGQGVYRASGSPFLPSWAGCQILLGTTLHLIQAVIIQDILVTLDVPFEQGNGITWAVNGAPAFGTELEGIYWS